MKITIGILGMSVLLMVSCVKSPEKKAEAMIKEQIQKTLYHPETYSPVETQVDSAFTPYDAPDFYEKALELAKLGMVVRECDDEAKSNKSSMSIYSVGIYQTAYERNEYREAKARYEQVMKRKDEAMKQVRELCREMKAEMEKTGEFIGFTALHTFRADNNAGNTLIGHAEFLFDKDMKEIVAGYEMDSNEYKAVQYLYRIMNGEVVALRDLDINDYQMLKGLKTISEILAE